MKNCLLSALRAGRGRPAAGAFLLAVATMPLMVGLDLPVIGSKATVTDVLVAACALLTLTTERLRVRRPGFLEAALVAYVGLTVVAALAAPDRTHALAYAIGVAELAVLALLAAHFARESDVFEAIATVVTASALLVGVAAIVALILFYAGVHTTLLGSYGEQVTPSPLFARVRLGFTSPPLLASWCLFASAVVAHPKSSVPIRWRRAAQGLLAFTVVFTFSRAILAFIVGWVIRWAGPRGRPAVAVGVTVAVLVVFAGLTVGRLHVEPSHPSRSTYVVPDPGNRREALATSLETIDAHPLLGIGPGSLPALNRGSPFKAHNTPVNVAATAGLPALAALLAFLVLLWRRRARPTDIALWSGLVALGIDGLVQDVDHFRHVWLALGLAAVHAGTLRHRDDPRATGPHPGATSPVG